jgi:hypothetical protein
MKTAVAARDVLECKNFAESIPLLSRHESKTRQLGNRPAFTPSVTPMKKLPYCPLVAGVLFVVFGTNTLFQLTQHAEPFGLLFPLLWDLIMVAIGLGVILRCDIARRAGVIWGLFCVIASVVIGVAAIRWMLQVRTESLGYDRIFFVFLAVAFGFLFGVWQWRVLQSPAAREWVRPGHHPADAQPHNGTP